MIKCRKYICCEFNRKPRPLGEINRFKATEFRQFLLYTGAIVLRNELPNEHYNLFMALHISCRILAIESLCLRYNDYAKQLLQDFLKNFAKLLGKEHLSFNFHGLLHIADDVKEFGPLDSFSAFRFENRLGGLKQNLRKPAQALQQIHRRLIEEKRRAFPAMISDAKPEFQRAHSDGPLSCNLSDPQYHRYSVNGVVFNVKTFDRFLLLQSGEIIEAKNFCYSTSTKGFVVIGNKWKFSDYYNFPCKSSTVGTFQLQNPDTVLSVHSVENITNKLQIIPDGDTLIAHTLIHQK
ncbi:unnamed protein product [Allacma fusca]|uniref:Uncharacterized protein n=1 Tax=Allacma fusca TaxID=39272 RepID=A0A8J2JPI2_9HEXA|nr:unnamed protein product [Allacma fusca]